MAKKKPKDNLFDGLTDKKAQDQTTATDKRKVKQPKRMGRPPKTEEEKEAIKIVNLRIHEDQLQMIDEHLKTTFQRNRHQYILDAVFQRIQKEKKQLNE